MSLIEEHFKLHGPPFPQVVDAAALLHHQSVKEALERLRFAVDRDGIALLSVESGCGKSTVLGCLCRELDPTNYLVVYTALSSLGPFSLLSSLGTKMGLRTLRFKGETAIELVSHLRSLPKRSVIILDVSCFELLVVAVSIADATVGSARLFGEVTDAELLDPGLEIGATDGLPWSCGCSATGATPGTTAFRHDACGPNTPKYRNNG